MPRPFYFGWPSPHVLRGQWWARGRSITRSTRGRSAAAKRGTGPGVSPWIARRGPTARVFLVRSCTVFVAETFGARVANARSGPRVVVRETVTRVRLQFHLDGPARLVQPNGLAAATHDV